MYRRLSFLLFALSLTGCAKSNDSEKTIKPLDQCVYIDDIGSYITYSKEIKLELNSESPVNNIKKILLTSNGDFVVLHAGGISVYDKTGKFISNIGMIGRANFEYLMPSDIAVSDDEDIIYVLDVNDMVVLYSLKTGEFVSRIGLNGYDNFEALAITKNDNLLAFRSNPPNYADFKDPFYALIQYDKKFNKKDSLLLRKDFVFSMGQITRSFDRSYIIRPQEGDNLYYKTDQKGLVPMWHIDFGNKKAPDKSIFRNGELDMSSYIRSDYYKLPIYLQETDKLLYFSAIGPKGLANDFIFSFDKNKGIHWSEKVAGEPVIIRSSDKDYFYAVYDDYNSSFSPEQLSNMNPLKRYIVEKMNVKLNETSNPVIIKFSIDI